MVASTVLHLCVLLVVALWPPRTPDGSQAIIDRPVGIAIVHRRPDRTRFVPPPPEKPDTQANPLGDPGASARGIDAAGPESPNSIIDLDAVLAEMKASVAAGRDGGSGIVNDPILGSGQALSGIGTHSQLGGPEAADGSETSTAVFGVTGSGSSFVYVFDRSDSMNGFGGRPLRAAKRELLSSLRTLTDRQQFGIVFYNERPDTFAASAGRGGLQFAEDAMVDAAVQYVGSINAYGGTRHLDAVLAALRLSPDVVFFLTDADTPRLNRSELRTIRSRATSSGTTIHAIEFGAANSPKPDTFLRDLAEAGNGQYRFVDVRNLP